MTFLPDELARYMEPAGPELFTSRNDPQDRRMGDVLHTFPPGDARPVVVLLGVPQDAGVQRNGGRTGAAGAPDAIRRTLYKYTPFDGTGLLTDNVTVIDIGNLAVQGLSLEEMHERQHQVVAFLVGQGRIPVTLGGGHDIAYPDVAGFGRAQQAFGVINLDPHTDVRPLLEGGRAHSGSPFRQMLEDSRLHIPSGAFVEFGIQRFAVAQAHAAYLAERGMTIMWYHDIRQQSFTDALRTAFDRATDGVRPLFVSFDMDSVRSADAPGVSATAPIGFTGEELCRAAEFFGASPLTGMIDLAEVNPAYDTDGRTAKLAALMIMHFLAGVAQRKSAQGLV